MEDGARWGRRGEICGWAGRYGVGLIHLIGAPQASE